MTVTFKYDDHLMNIVQSNLDVHKLDNEFDLSIDETKYLRNSLRDEFSCTRESGHEYSGELDELNNLTIVLDLFPEVDTARMLITRFTNLRLDPKFYLGMDRLPPSVSLDAAWANASSYIKISGSRSFFVTKYLDSPGAKLELVKNISPIYQKHLDSTN